MVLTGEPVEPMKGNFSSPVPFYPLPPDKGDYHYTLYSRTVKENCCKILPPNYGCKRVQETANIFDFWGLT